jgi:peptidyl-prolyl cis-trans isomerase B (cyclophilin B)
VRVNGLAVSALICAFVLPPFGILMGHIAWSQCRRERRPGAGLALAAMIIGYTLLLVVCGLPIIYLT